MLKIDIDNIRKNIVLYYKYYIKNNLNILL